MRQELIRILIVEDELPHANAIMRCLLSSGPAYEVSIADSLQQCRQQVKTFCPDILLLDLNLPDGQAISYLKEDPEDRTFPVLILTAQGSEELAVEVIKAGALDYIVKTPETFVAMPRIVERSLREWETLQDRHRAEAEAGQARQEWEMTFDAMSEVITIHDKQMRIIRANRAAYRLTGFLPGELVGMRCCEALWSKSGVCSECPQVQTIWDGKSHSGVVYHQQKEKIFEITTTPFPATSDQEYYIHVARDITTQKKYEKQLEFQATHDLLTGLTNRVLLKDRLDQAISYAQRSGRIVALVLLDLDRFKVVNDTLGHALGDELLCHVARRLKQTVRDTDTVARFGGDEFVVMLTQVANRDDVIEVVGNISAALTAPYELGERRFNLSASVGVSLYPIHSDDSDTLIRYADIAMYQAKKSGNCCSLYSSEMDLEGADTLELENDLHLAVEHRELSLHYQPKVDLRTGLIAGCEALLRWRHPQRGMIPPAKFIPIAEQTGLIVPIGRWVIEEACRQSLSWQAAGLPCIRIAVNLSARQFRLGDLADTMGAVLADFGLNSDLLELEITESMIMDDPERASKTLHELKKLGLHLSLDDFGTGYSSLNYLRRFPVDSLKIDQSFIHDVTTDPSGASVVASIVDIAHNLNLVAIAEGVETSEQLDFLVANECDVVQGYLFSKPLPADKFAALLKQGNRWPVEKIPAFQRL
jgi:diguanylate cyclase (GGDEF)-like protein/PAS domain S-box-containing protein